MEQPSPCVSPPFVRAGRLALGLAVGDEQRARIGPHRERAGVAQGEHDVVVLAEHVGRRVAELAAVEVGVHVALEAADRGLRQAHAPEPEEVAQRGAERLVGLEVDDAGCVVRAQPGLDLAALVDADVRGHGDEQAVVVEVQERVQAELLLARVRQPQLSIRAATVAGSIGHGGLDVRPSATVPASCAEDDDPQAVTATASSASTRTRGRRTAAHGSRPARAGPPHAPRPQRPARRLPSVA